MPPPNESVQDILDAVEIAIETDMYNTDIYRGYSKIPFPRKEEILEAIAYTKAFMAYLSTHFTPEINNNLHYPIQPSQTKFPSHQVN